MNCSVALATKENLQSQRGVLHGVTSRLSAVTSILFIIQFISVFLIFLSMNVILSCLPLKDRLAFVYCHGHYYEMSWFFYPIFWFKRVETPRHISEKSYNYYQYYYQYYHQNYSLLLLFVIRGANKRFLLSDDCTLLSLTSFSARFPALNSLIQRINVRKRRDSIILASVISICIILMLIYALG